MRVLVFSHGHPTFSKGGGEIAAYNLFRGLKETPDMETWFCARADYGLMNAGSRLSTLGEREFLLVGAARLDHLTSPIAYWKGDDFVPLLKELNPNVVHLHHYVHLGIEIIRTIRNVLPNAHIFLTLHEYIAICSNSGQMIKTSGRLCYQASPRECVQCFPGKAPEDFFLRERYIKSFFDLVDHFVSPSAFLRERYIAWGLDPQRISVIENGLPEGERLPPRSLAEGEARGRFAYFGQINPFKGVDLILEAFSKLPRKIRSQVSLDIFGSGLESQPQEYREKIADLLAANKGVVRLHGPYEQDELPRIMRSIDWVVMGSVWWENSPVVIQEAFKFGRPVLCPDIGGMAEKVPDGIGGLHYRARDPVALCSLIQSIFIKPELYETLVRSLPSYKTLGDYSNDHLALYRRCLQ
jgi:glycosyltransferase involved in cell wall biosynthesis